MMDMQLIRICAWCGCSLGPPKPSLEDGVTHGICESCKDRFRYRGKAGVKI